MIWYKRSGFHSNPFSIKPAAFHDEIVGQNIKKVMQKLDKGGFVFIKGEYGTGKTAMLKRIINRHKGKGTLIYINLEFIEEVKVKELLRKRANLLQKIFRRIPRNTILLIDEAQRMKKSISKDIQSFFESGFIKSVVFVGTKVDNKVFSEELAKGLKGNVVSLKTLTPQQAVKLVRKRIGNVLLSDKIIKEIFSHSKNPRLFLENCEDVCKYVIDIYNSKADLEHVKAVLGKKKVKTKGKAKRKKSLKKKRKKAVKKKRKTMRKKKKVKTRKVKTKKTKGKKVKRKKLQRKNTKKKNKTNKKKGKVSSEGKEMEFYIDTEGYPEYSFKREF